MTFTATGSNLTKFTFREFIDIERINKILSLDYKNIFKLSLEESVDIKILLNKLSKKAKKSKGFIDVKYKQIKKFGRVYPEKNLSISQINRKIRHSLLQYYYYDFDIVNAQPSILNEYCIKNGIKSGFLKIYVKNRDEILNEIMTIYTVSKEDAKKLIISLLNGGEFTHWEKNKEFIQPTVFIDSFVKSISEIKSEIKIKNLTLWQKIESGIIKDLQETNKTLFNIEGKTFSRFIQDLELKVLECMLGSNNFNIDGTIEMSLCHDGVLLKKEDIKNINFVCEMMSKNVKDCLGYTIQVINKPFDEAIDIDSLEFGTNTEDSDDESDNVYENADYLIMKENLEKDNGFFYSTDLKEWFIKGRTYTGDVWYNQHSRGEIFSSLEEYRFIHRQKVEGGYSKKEYSFFDVWSKDINKRKIKNFVYELDPNIKVSPDYIQLWEGFDILKFKPSEDKKTLEIVFNMIDRWLNVLCDNNADVVKYNKNWIASLIQMPHKNVITSLLFASNEHGSGKSTLPVFINSILGDKTGKKYMCDGTGFNNLFPADGFNSHLKDVFIYLADELNGANFKQHKAQYKQFVQSQNIILNEKGEKKLTIPNKIRIVMTTNTTNPVEIDETERRIVSSEVRGDLLGDENKTLFWKPFYEYLNDSSICRSIYDYFAELDISTFNHRELPATRLNTILAEASRPPIQTYIYENISYLKEKSEFAIKGVDLLTHYNKWCEKQKLTGLNSVSFGLQLARDTICKKLFTKTQPKNSIWRINTDILEELEKETCMLDTE